MCDVTKCHLWDGELLIPPEPMEYSSESPNVSPQAGVTHILE